MSDNSATIAASDDGPAANTTRQDVQPAASSFRSELVDPPGSELHRVWLEEQVHPSKTWHFKYWCPYCVRSYCCPVEMYVCKNIQQCKLLFTGTRPQVHDAFRMIRAPHPKSSNCFEVKYENNLELGDYSDSD